MDGTEARPAPNVDELSKFIRELFEAFLEEYVSLRPLLCTIRAISPQILTDIMS